MKSKISSKDITISGLLIALGIILPFATAHGIGVPGNILLPMHIPVLLAGFLCGPFLGGVIGLLLPVLNCLLTGMPALYPTLPGMAAELLTYGFVSGLLYKKTPLHKKKWGVYPALIVAMISGRLVYGIVRYILLALDESVKALSVWDAVVKGLAGIVIQLVFVPAVVAAVESGFARTKKSSVNSAKNLISTDAAVLAVIKNGEIVKTYQGRGVVPAINALEDGILNDAYIVDKVIGKASAMILSLGGVKGVTGVIMSRPALEYLRSAGIDAEYDVLCEYIENRTKDGMCPMEQTVKDLSDPKAALEAVKAKQQELRSK